MVLSRKRFIGTLLGNFFEHYDTALFGLLAPFLAPLFFAHKDPLSALMMTYGIMPISVVARPLGAYVLGYIGDCCSREQALFVSLLGMAITSLSIAFIPTYAVAGAVAPLLLAFGRALQGFFAAGEAMGGGIYLLEATTQKKHDLLSGIYSASSIGGHLLASLGLYLMSSYGIIEWGWRWLFIFGLVPGFFGLLLRRSNSRIPLQKRAFEKISLKDYRRSFLLIFLCAGFAHATFSIALVLPNGLIPLISQVSKVQVIRMNTYLLVLDGCALIFFGWLAAKVSRERVMFLASFGAALLALPMLAALQSNSIYVLIGIRVMLVLIGVAFFAPFHAWSQSLVPRAARYRVISLGYSLGSRMLGAPTAAFSLWCYQKTGTVYGVGWYWAALGLASSLAIVASARQAAKEIG